MLSPLDFRSYHEGYITKAVLLVHCRIFSSVADLCPSDVPLPVVIIRKDTIKCPREGKLLSLRATDLRNHNHIFAVPFPQYKSQAEECLSLETFHEIQGYSEEAGRSGSKERPTCY